ncbi:two-component system sensor histidine kinase NtrB [Agaribacterium haliotis]|uniref:two-component system sensor histidine kinase NtrB n=1 Tax=Agaribacterium haliotis TaxID=2013869 RepID=UPI001EFE34F1|nr:ATP-binding protein [Agaribacterium haliotis]
MIIKMFKYLSLAPALVLGFSIEACALDVFKDEDGHTKWQHVANFSGSVLIILLSITMASLLFSRFKLRTRNRELREIKQNLEKTVAKRTENLRRSNEALEGEIAEHKATSQLLQSSENYLQSILSSMPSMLIGLNNEFEIITWNSMAESISGLSAADVEGKNLWQVYPTITVSEAQVKSVQQGGQPQSIKHSQRGQYYFDITIYPLGGSSDGVVVVVDNVTQRSLAENMLIQRDKMASMGELAATMAHDVNIPLQGILRDVQAVASELGLKHPQLVALLEDAADRGKQASAIVNNLLEFSEAYASEKHEADLCSILDHCIELAKNVLAEPQGLRFRDIHLSRHYSDGLPKLMCYSAELQQVFLSLFRHCVRAMDSKKRKRGDYVPELCVEINEAYDALWVKIKHNGEGLSPQEQQEVFEPFVQHTSPAQPKPVLQENRLSFSYFIVTEHHDGELAVTSDAEQGTVFHAQFQLKKAG